MKLSPPRAAGPKAIPVSERDLGMAHLLVLLPIVLFGIAMLVIVR